jgi:glycosyltransferase involved in cell wall biosynthesis
MVRVLVFRKRLLAWSETFIADQCRFMPTSTVLPCGVTADATGKHLLAKLPQHTILHQGGPKDAYRAWQLKRRGYLSPAWEKRLRHHQPDLIHAHFGPDGLTALAIKQALNIPLIVTFHGFDICIEQPYNKYRRSMQSIFAQADGIIAVSDFIAEKLRHHGCPPQKIRQHYIGIQTDFFKQDHSDRRDIVFVGRMVEKKGCRDLIEAYLSLQKKHQGQLPHRLRMIGDGTLVDELKKRCHTEKYLRQHVRWEGRQTPDYIAQALRSAAVFCGPSCSGKDGDAEGLGMVFLEAQASGTPVVSTLHGGIPEAVEHGTTGLLVDERRVDTLNTALDHVLNDDDLRKQMGKAAAQRVQSRFDVRKQCEKLERIYREIVGEFRP